MQINRTRAKAAVAALALTAGAVAMSAPPASAMSYVPCGNGAIITYLWTSNTTLAGYRCYSGVGDDVYSGVWEFGAIDSQAWTGHVWWNANEDNYEWPNTYYTYYFSAYSADSDLNNIRLY